MAAGVAQLGLDAQDRHLLTLAQVSFPLVERPYAALGEKTGLSEDAVIARMLRAREAGLVRRIGPVFEPAALGLMTELFAAEVDPVHLDAVGTRVATWGPVTHCYERDHPVNLWFTGAATNATWFEKASHDIAGWEGVRGVWRLPTLRRFKIGVVFDLVNDVPGAERVSASASVLDVGSGWDSRTAAVAVELELLRAAEADLPLLPTPFAALTSDVDALLEALRGWLARGVVRRYGAQLSHRRLGYIANAMTVWVASPEMIEQAGATMAAAPEVTHCYQRPPFPGFPYTLYAMIHGRSRDACAAIAQRLSRQCGLEDGLALFSLKEYRKSSPRYSELLTARLAI